jgi:hypothetical protein
MFKYLKWRLFWTTQMGQLTIRDCYKGKMEIGEESEEMQQ